MSDQSQPFPWPAGSATGVGSMPGDDPVEVCRIVFGELPDLPYLPELPGRGPGAEMTGRTACLLVDMPVQITPRGWKLADRPGRDMTRAAGYLSHDLDALEEVAESYSGPVKVQVCGPWTLAAALELSRSLNPALADLGAVADLTESLAEGVAAHVADVRKRLPGATLVVQIDEPSLPAVLAGRVPTASGLGTVAAIDQLVASQRLATVLSATDAFTVVHCCARATPFLQIKAAGAAAVSFDVAFVGSKETDEIAELAEGGLALFAGAMPTSSAYRLVSGPPFAPRQTAEIVVQLWRRTALAAAEFARHVVITPACGLAGVSPAAARAVLEHCREAGRIGLEMIAGE
ncbi:MAG TPA: methionine synthase [Streptosporangiaceae bacterium]|nr:methionine synthase [Streptosporangiaceae bacterium]